MKFLLLLPFFGILLISASDCGKKNDNNTIYKGRLEIKAICSNYTISVIEGNIDTSLIVASWTDENTGKPYKNVFKLDEACIFPASLNQGDEFYFKVDTSGPKGCIVCMAYYPVPPKKLPIVVVEK